MNNGKDALLVRMDIDLKLLEEQIDALVAANAEVNVVNPALDGLENMLSMIRSHLTDGKEITLDAAIYDEGGVYVAPACPHCGKVGDIRVFTKESVKQEYSPSDGDWTEAGEIADCDPEYIDIDCAECDETIADERDPRNLERWLRKFRIRENNV